MARATPALVAERRRDPGLKVLSLLGIAGAGWVAIHHGRVLGVLAFLAWLAFLLLARRALRRKRRRRRWDSSRPPIPYRVRRRVMRRCGYRCVRCGSSGEPGNPLQIDHIVPRSWGGADAEQNYQILCRRDNLAKGARYIG